MLSPAAPHLLLSPMPSWGCGVGFPGGQWEVVSSGSCLCWNSGTHAPRGQPVPVGKTHALENTETRSLCEKTLTWAQESMGICDAFVMPM